MPQVLGPLIFSAALSTGATSVGLGAGGAVVYSTTAVAISNAVAAGLFTGGLLAVSLLTQPKPPGSPEQAKTTIEHEEAPRRFILGRGRISGTRVFRCDSEAGVPNFEDGGVLFDLLAMCQGPLDEVEEFYLAGREVVVDKANAAVSSVPYKRAAGSGDSRAFLNVKYGVGSQTAFTEMITQFPRDWTADHRGRGVIVTMARFSSPDQLRHMTYWPDGPPLVEMLLRVGKWYDPRDGVTRWSDNGVLSVLHLLTADPKEGGWGMALSAFDLDDIAREADKADAPIALKGGGTEPRSRVGGSYTSDTRREDLLANVLLSTGTQILPTQAGKYTIRLIDDQPVPTASLAERHILSGSWSGGPEAPERPNRLVGSYLSSERGWDMGEIPFQTYADGEFTGIAWSIDQDEIDRVGERIEDIKLQFCPSVGQASRIMRRLFALRRAPRGTMTANLAGLTLMGHSTVTLPIPDLDEMITANLEAPRFEEGQTMVSLPFVEHPTLSAWQPQVDEPDPPKVKTEISDTYSPDAPTIDSITFVPPVDWPTNTVGTLSVVASGEPGAEIYEGAYRIIADGKPSRWISLAETVGPTSATMTDGGIEVGTVVQVRCRVSLGISKWPGPWCEIVEQTLNYP